jgi:hypothetical protein
MSAKRCRFLYLMLVACPQLIAAEESFTGSVKTLQGRVAVIRGGRTLPCVDGMHILANDVIRTASDGRTGLILRDGTRLSLGPDTELTIERFLYEPAEGRFALLVQLVRGVAVYVSGKIAQFSPESVRVQTPVGFIGLRGTEFGVKLE